MNRVDFFMGFFVGYVVSGILGFVMQKIRAAKAKAGAHNRPQTVGQKTDKTPMDVVRDSRAAAFSRLLWTLVLLLFLALLVYLTYYYLL